MKLNSNPPLVLRLSTPAAFPPVRHTRCFSTGTPLHRYGTCHSSTIKRRLLPTGTWAHSQGSALHIIFVMCKVTLDQYLSEYFGCTLLVITLILYAHLSSLLRCDCPHPSSGALSLTDLTDHSMLKAVRVMTS